MASNVEHSNNGWETEHKTDQDNNAQNQTIPSSPFRFLDLPRELRDTVYRNLLCSWLPQPETTHPDDIFKFGLAQKDIHPAILRTCKLVYRESYEAMVKTNRFVKVTSERGLPLHTLICGPRVPVVVSHEYNFMADNFRGYVIRIHLWSSDLEHPVKNNLTESIDDWTLAPQSFMILHRDLDDFCMALMSGDGMFRGFSSIVNLKITLGPNFDTTSRGLEGFFTHATQRGLLKPFQQLFGIEAITIDGQVSDETSKSVKQRISQPRMLDPKGILADLMAAKEKGSQLFRHDKGEAAEVWQEAAMNIEKLLGSSTWDNIVQRSDDEFMSQLAEVYFLTKLNDAAAQIVFMQDPSLDDDGLAAMFCEGALMFAAKSRSQDFWKPGYRARMQPQHMAKFWYRYALYYRLKNERGKSHFALQHIDRAHALQPNDPAILAERERIRHWFAREEARIRATRGR